MPLELVAGLQVAIANVALVAEAGVGVEANVDLPQGHRVRLREIPVSSAAVYVPGGRAPYASTVVMGVVTARAAGRDRRGRLLSAGRRRADRRGDPRHLQALRGRKGLPDGRRSGDRRPRLRHRVSRCGRRDRGPGEPVCAGGKAPALHGGRHRRLRRTLGSHGRARRRCRAMQRWSWQRSTCWPRPSTGRAAWWWASPRHRLCAIGSMPTCEQLVLERPTVGEAAFAIVAVGRRPGGVGAGQRVRRRAPRADRLGGRGVGSDGAISGLPVRGRRQRDRLRRLCLRLESHPADRRRGTICLRSFAAALPPPYDRGENRWGGPQAGGSGGADRTRRGLRGACGVDGGAGKGE